MAVLLAIAVAAGWVDGVAAVEVVASGPDVVAVGGVGVVDAPDWSHAETRPSTSTKSATEKLACTFVVPKVQNLGSKI
jgi:hypothetical protein